MLKKQRPIIINFPSINADELTPEQLYRHIKMEFVRLSHQQAPLKSQS